MRNKIVILVAALLFLTGLGVLFYPAYKTNLLQKAEQSAIAEFEQYRTSVGKRDATPSSQEAGEADADAAQSRAFPELWEACIAFNEQLPATQRTTCSAESLQRPSVCVSDYCWEQEVFGTLSIPAADLSVPLYLGANARNLDRGAAILGQTSMPIGGESTNSVIAGHRTWSGAIQFNRLEKLTPGDVVYLTNPWETLTYAVIETKIILPDDTEEIMVREGRDLLTVFTCTNPNTRRYLVICERIDEEREEGEDIAWNMILMP